MKEITYNEAKEIKKLIDEKCNVLSKKLNSFPKGDMGLVVEEIRLSNEYQSIKREFEKSFKELQEFNKWFMKRFKKEYAKERRENYYSKFSNH